jgi:hypothetical protein
VNHIDRFELVSIEARSAQLNVVRIATNSQLLRNYLGRRYNLRGLKLRLFGIKQFHPHFKAVLRSMPGTILTQEAVATITSRCDSYHIAGRLY